MLLNAGCWVDMVVVEVMDVWPPPLRVESQIQLNAYQLGEGL